MALTCQIHLGFALLGAFRQLGQRAEVLASSQAELRYAEGALAWRTHHGPVFHPDPRSGWQWVRTSDQRRRLGSVSRLSIVRSCQAWPASLDETARRCAPAGLPQPRGRRQRSGLGSKPHTDRAYRLGARQGARTLSLGFGQRAIRPVTCRAGDRDRTGMASLEGWGSAIELHPREQLIVHGSARRPGLPKLSSAGCAGASRAAAALLRGRGRSQNPTPSGRWLVAGTGSAGGSRTR
jgi:hypothetical protein